MGSRKEEIPEEIPEKLYDEINKVTYKRLRFFGKVSLIHNFILSTLTRS